MSKKVPTPSDEVEAAKILAMLADVRASDDDAQKALDNVRKYLKEQIGLNVYQH